MTRGQRRAHGIGWLLLGALLALASAHALGARRAAWSGAEAIRDAPRTPAGAAGGAP